MKKGLGVLVVALLLLMAVVLIRASQFASPVQVDAAPLPDLQWQEMALAERLAGSLRFKTIAESKQMIQPRAAEFEALQAYLRKHFPRVFAELPLKTFYQLGLMFRWQGSDPSLAPMMLIAHQDVVPVLPGTEAEWSYPPYSGTVADGYIWGRGAVDDKSGVLGILEAVERLLSEGYQPERTVYLGFGHDEEVGGDYGALAMANYLAEQGERLAFLLDEGGVIGRDVVPGIPEPVALIGPGEKGYISLRLSARGLGGHSSMPPKHSALGLVARAAARLEAEPFPADLQYIGNTLRALGDKVPFDQRLVFANLWLFGPIAEGILSANPKTNATIRTTTAVTMASASSKENVLPINAEVVVNFRILPGDSIDSVIARVAEVIDDEQVSIELYKNFANNPSPQADIEGPAYKTMASLVKQLRPDVLVAPNLVVAATDARHFNAVADNSFRFMALELSAAEVAGIHGTDERVAIKSYVEAVSFYYWLIKRSRQLTD